MILQRLLLAASCGLAPLVLCSPVQTGAYGYTLADVEAAVDEYEIAHSRAVQGVQAASACNGQKCSCEGQSCIVADLAGSTGRKVKQRPIGGTEKDFKCIAKYNPQGVADAKTAPLADKQALGISSSLLGAMNNLQALTAGKTDKGTFTGSCKANIVIFAKGTTEPTRLGITIGPALSTALRGRDWLVVGVGYDADVPGDYCLGLPGGMVAKDLINQAATKCPDSKLFVSGYSQGAMVARNGVAYADASAKAKVAGVVTFGDPFQGAPIKGYTGPIITYCNDGDGVCTGNFELAGSHLSYVGKQSTAAVSEIKKLAAQPLRSASSDRPSGGSSSKGSSASKGSKGGGSAPPAEEEPAEEEAAPATAPKKTTKKPASKSSLRY